jgi:voltage-gated potassium channel
MSVSYRLLVGMGGVPPNDNPEAYVWERRLHWVMVAVALLALPAFYLELSSPTGLLQQVGNVLDFCILGAFVTEFVWMLHLTHQKRLFVIHNWLNLLIIFAAAMSFAGIESEWVPLARLFRLAYVSLLFARVIGALRHLFSPSGVPYVLGWGVVTMALAGAGFYWLEPTVHSYGEGLWLAFTSGATVGYGDIVPTTEASRIFAVLMVVFGYAVLSMVTASIAAFFIGEDEKRLREEMHKDIKELRIEVEAMRKQLKDMVSDAGKPGSNL